MLNAKMNNLAATSPSTSGGTGYYQNWHYTGQFKGVFAGGWWEGFGGQGDGVFLWSCSAHPGWSDGASSAVFDAVSADPGNSGGNRYYGYGVRCLLN